MKRIIALSTAMCLLVSAVPWRIEATENTGYSTGFETTLETVQTEGWSFVNGTSESNITIRNNIDGANQKCLSIYRENPQQDAAALGTVTEAIYSRTPITGNVQVQFKAAQVINGGGKTIALKDGSGKVISGVYFAAKKSNISIAYINKIDANTGSEVVIDESNDTREWLDCRFVLDFTNKTFDFYLNGQLYLQDKAFYDTQANNFSMLSAYMGGSDFGNMYLDDFSVSCNADDPQEPEEEEPEDKEPEEDESPEEDENPEGAGNIEYSTNFETTLETLRTEGWSFANGTSSSAISVPNNIAGTEQKCLSIYRANPQQDAEALGTVTEAVYRQKPITGNVEVQFKTAQAVNGSGKTIALKDGLGKVISGVYFAAKRSNVSVVYVNKIDNNISSEVVIDESNDTREWLDCRFVLDFTDKTFDFYLNGQLYLQDKAFYNTQANNFSTLSAYVSGSDFGNLYLEDFSVSGGTVDQGIYADFYGDYRAQSSLTLRVQGTGDLLGAVALYNTEGKMIKAAAKSFTKGGTVVLTLPADLRNTTAKAFLWDIQMRPIESFAQRSFEAERTSIDAKTAMDLTLAGGKMDRYGQFIPAKPYMQTVYSTDQEVADDAITQAAPELDTQKYDSYGGILEFAEDGSRINHGATGYFYQKWIDGKAWLITPEGNKFYYKAMCTAQPYIYSPVTEFEGLPAQDGMFAAAFNTSDTENIQYSPLIANSILKYGQANWKSGYVNEMKTNLRQWGFNAIGGWTTREAYQYNMPYVYVIKLGDLQAYATKLGKQLPDPFDPNLEEAIYKHVSGVLNNRSGKQLATDPNFIAYGIGNEMEFNGWGNKEHCKVINSIMAKGADSYVKQDMVEWLQTKYNSFAEFEALWQTGATSWSTLLSKKISKYDGDSKAQEAVDVMNAYIDRFCDQLFSTCVRAIRRFDTNHMIWGPRFITWPSNTVVRSAAEHFDAISFDVYSYKFYDVVFDRYYEACKEFNTPFLITEYGNESMDIPHYAAPETRADYGSVKLMAPLENNTKRGQAYAHQTEAMADKPYFIGASYFHLHRGLPSGVVTEDGRYSETLTGFMAETNHKLEAIHNGDIEEITPVVFPEGFLTTIYKVSLKVPVDGKILQELGIYTVDAPDH